MSKLVLTFSRNFEMGSRCRRWFQTALVLTVAGLLAGCAGDPAASSGTPQDSTASFGPGYPPGSAAWDPDSRSAYRGGFFAGMQDEKEGFRYDDDRGAAVLDVEVRGFYRQGYRRGYYHEANLRRQERKAAEEASPAENE